MTTTALGPIALGSCPTCGGPAQFIADPDPATHAPDCGFFRDEVCRCSSPAETHHVDASTRLRRAAEDVATAADQLRHIVEFSRTGYGLQHPLACRPDLLRCPVQLYLAGRRKPDRRPGRYFVDEDGTYEATTQPDPLIPFIEALGRLRAVLR